MNKKPPPTKSIEVITLVLVVVLILLVGTNIVLNYQSNEALKENIAVLYHLLTESPTTTVTPINTPTFTLTDAPQPTLTFTLTSPPTETATTTPSSTFTFTPSPTETLIPGLCSGTIQVNNAPLREQPLISFAVSRQLPANTQVEIINRQTDWLHIAYGNGRDDAGWLPVAYVNVESGCELFP